MNESALTNSQLIILPLSDEEDKGSAFKNRIRKNYKHIRKWAKRSFTDSFRIYDKDIKEYPVAIDYYAGRFLVHCFADNEKKLEDLRKEVEETIFSIFGFNSPIYWRTRIKRAKTEQYAKIDNQNLFFTVYEYGVKFYINLQDYLDTGLFLDHRETRQLAAQLSKGKTLLNLFAYTCSFSVHAALAGAIRTTSVDLSNTYTNWGKQNFILNNIPLKNHHIIREDCLKFLEQETRKYDVIVIDPPTISRSKKMEQMFDIQLDHVQILSKALTLLNENGTLIFSTNSRKFILNENAFQSCLITDITQKTIPMDFHNQKIHYCWKINPKT